MLIGEGECLDLKLSLGSLELCPEKGDLQAAQL
jgi:hypothetical protein